MTVLSSLMDHIGRLVHPDARASDIEGARQRIFIATRSGLFLAAIAALPVYLACGHVPAMWEAIALAWLSVPLVAAAYVSRTGRMSVAEAACLVAWIGLAITLCLGGALSLWGALVLLLMVPLEAAFSSDPRLVPGSIAAIILAAVGLAAFSAIGLAGAAGLTHVGNDAAFLFPAMAYSVALAALAATLQRERERMHRLEEQRHRVLSEAIGDLVIRYDRSAGVLLASRECEPLFGIKPRELLGRGFFERVHVADRPAFLKLFSDAAVSGANVAATLRLRISRGAVEPGGAEEPVFAWIELRARRFEPGGPNLASETDIVAIVRDITAQMRHEQAIQQARDDAQRANAWKDSFLANVSHELRTPLNAIIGFSEMLSSEELSPRDLSKQREYAGIIAASGQHLLSVVNSLLDISKIEAGRFDLNPESYDVAVMLQSCCDMVGLKAAQAGIALVRNDLQEPLGEMIADKRACKQIVINLLSNALKFTPRGGHVTIGARPQGNSVLISVADTGVGIAAKDMPSLGDAFFQGMSGYDRAYEGTGLGLSVVRGLVGLHGGGVAIESAPGEGTRVTVRLPLDCRNANGGGAVKIDAVPRYTRANPSVSSPDLPKVQKIA